MFGTILAFLGLGGLTTSGLIATVFPWVAGISGAGGVVSYVVNRLVPSSPVTAKIKLYLEIAAVALVAIAVFSGGFYLKALIDRSKTLRQIEVSIDGLEHSLGCDERENASERDLFACLPAQRADAEEAARKVAEHQALVDALAAEEELQREAKIDQETSVLNAAIDAASAADDGPLPTVMLDNWARKRSRR